MPKPALPVAERFWGKVNKTETCWLWMGIPREKGYGTFHPTKKTTMLAHRWAWIESNGHVPDGLFCCHKCDVPACVRPDHMFLGTKAENNADMKKKGRHARGEKMGGSKFTTEQVIEMRDMYIDGKTVNSIARHFRTAHPSVSMIVQGVTWQHLLRPCDIARGRKTSRGPSVKSL